MHEEVGNGNMLEQLLSVYQYFCNIVNIVKVN